MSHRLVLSALLLVAASAGAQSPPAGFTSKDVTMPPDQPTTTSASPSSSDPRVCLEFEDRMQIIACANKYLPRKRAAKG